LAGTDIAEDQKIAAFGSSCRDLMLDADIFEDEPVGTALHHCSDLLAGEVDGRSAVLAISYLTFGF
jgi:hypothetical protein